MSNIIVRSNDPVVDEKPSSGVAPKAEPVQEIEQEQNIESTESDTVESEQEDDADLSADSEESEADESDKTRAKKKGGFKRRIDKLNARVSEREKELDYWKSQALKNQERNAPEETKQVTQSTSGKPSPDDFDSHADYVESLTDWKVTQFYETQKANEQKSNMHTEQQKAFKSHVDRVNSFAEKNPDFHELIDDVNDVPMSATIQDIIISSDNGPALMYELAKNKDAFTAICKMSPLAAARAIGALDARLSSSSSEQSLTKKITSAPKPLSSVASGKSVVSKSIDDPNLSQREYERLRGEQMRNRA